MAAPCAVSGTNGRMPAMKVLVVGSGAREHAIVWKLLQDARVRDVVVAPGNAGTALIAHNVEIDPLNNRQIADFALANHVELVVIGPEGPLAAGLADDIGGFGIPVFGPSRAAARIESSKWYAKELMRQAGIPTAAAEHFTSLHDAKAYVNYRSRPLAIKADGLAGGKGVTVAANAEEAIIALETIMVQLAYGEAGQTVVIEELLEGNEVSLMAFVDGQTVSPMVPACDYKRAGTGDIGPNTGGMGSYSPPSFFGPADVKAATERVLVPAVRALAQAGTPFKGVLYAGLMLTSEGPKVIEFNARFGDPETEVVLPRLKSSLLDIMLAVVQGNLNALTIEWDSEPCVGVVMASEGYPIKPRTGDRIEGLDRAAPGTLIFHGATRLVHRTERSRFVVPGRRPDPTPTGPAEVLTDGGRVLTVVAKGRTMAAARRSAYATLDQIEIPGAYYRFDIAEREMVISPDLYEQAPLLPVEDSEAAPQPAVLSAEPDANAQSRLAALQSQIQSGASPVLIAALRELVDQYPAWSEPVRALADANLRLGRFEDAARTWNRLIRMDPADPTAHHNLGAIYARQNEFELAEIEMREAIRISPDYVDAVSGLSTLLARRGDHAGALSQIEHAVRLQPKSAQLRLDFAQILDRGGERERAVEQARFASSLAQDQATRDDADTFIRRASGRRWFG